MNDSKRLPKILLIENDPVIAAEIRGMLHNEVPPSFTVEWVRRLSEGVQRLRKKGIAAVLFELSLPDSRGIETFERILRAAPDVAMLILSGNADEQFAQQAVARGAQDYLLLGRLDNYLLHRALCNGIERKAIEDALFAEKERAQVTLNSIGDAVLCTNISGKITYLNTVAEVMTGWQLEEAMGRRLSVVFRIIDAFTRKTARDPMKMAIEQNSPVGLTDDCVLIRRDGLESAIEDSAAPIHDRTGQITGAVIVFRDVSVAREMSNKITHSAQHDVLTNLPNRLLLNDRISQSISLSQRQKRQFAVLFLDLDGFKCINDSFGHAVGDKLLRSVSERLLSSVRSSDTVSRQGGDEFVILLSEIAHPEDAGISARKILSSLNADHAIEGQNLRIDGSIGISVYPYDGKDAETLIKNADTAMYLAKESGHNRARFFKAEINKQDVKRRHVAMA